VELEFPDSPGMTDGVANRDRAPLVWRYLQSNFRPAFAENGVVIWRRILD
jgi:hypothetical protein